MIMVLEGFSTDLTYCAWYLAQRSTDAEIDRERASKPCNSGNLYSLKEADHPTDAL